MYSIHGQAPVRHQAQPLEFVKPTHAWRFLGEHITAIPDAVYPPNPKVVKAVQEFEPEAVFLFVRSAYVSPAGTEHVFGRHAVAIAPRDRQARHQVVRALHPTLTPSPRFPLVLDSIWQDRSVSLIPDLKVFGYKPLDWEFYHAAKKAWIEMKETPVDTAEKDARRDYEGYTQSTAEAKAKVDAEADYRFDHVTNKGRTIRDEIMSLTHEDARRLGMSRRRAS